MELMEHTAKSHQLMSRIGGMIASGRLTPGTRIMSLRKLAAEFNVSIDVARNAIRLLEEKQLVVSRHGSGTFVNPDARPAATRLVGLLTSYGQHDIENYFEPLFEAAAETRVVPMVAQLRNDSDWRQTVSDLVARRPDLILIDVEAKGYPLHELENLCGDIPLCFCNRWEWYPERPEDHGMAVLVDYKQAYAEGLRRLLEHGHRRIAIAMQHRNPEPFAKMEIDYALRDNDLSWNSPEIFITTREEIVKTPDKVVAALNSYAPTAILAASDYIIHQLAEICPFTDETERVGLFNLRYSQMRNHEFSSFDPDFKRLWITALDPVLHNMRNVPPKLILRHSAIQALAV